MTEDVARDIGSELGSVTKVDNKPFDSDQARFLRIKVDLPLDQPLRRGSPIVNLEGDSFVVTFKYERLVGLCCTCGCLGHEMKQCIVHQPAGKQERPYGYWMKAGGKRWGDRSEETLASTPPHHEEPGTESAPDNQPPQPPSHLAEWSLRAPPLTMAPVHSDKEHVPTSTADPIDPTTQDEFLKDINVNPVATPLCPLVQTLEPPMPCKTIAPSLDIDHLHKTHMDTPSPQYPSTNPIQTSWKRIVRTPTQSMVVDEGGFVHVGSKRGHYLNEDVDLADLGCGKRQRTLSTHDSPTATTAEAAIQPRRAQ